MAHTIYLIIEILGVMTAARAIYFARTSQGAISWGISLVIFPFLALPLYWTIGYKNFFWRVSIRQNMNDKLKKHFFEVLKFLEVCSESQKSENRISQEDPLEIFEEITALPFLDNNKVECFFDGKKLYADLFDEIKRCKKSIIIQFFIIQNDVVGQELITLLTAKAKEGVQVYLLYDSIGSYNLPDDFFEDLIDSGGEVHGFSMFGSRFNKYQLNFRNHRKLVILDNQKSYLGGMNIGCEYQGAHRRLSPWRDLMIKIHGPLSICLQISFVEDWYWESAKTPVLDWNPVMTEGGSKGVVLSSGPADRIDKITFFITSLFSKAKKSIKISSPYFIPTPEVLAALKLASLRGVKVSIMTPAKADHYLVWLANQFYLEVCEGEGFDIWHFNEGFLHQKLILVDDDFTFVGSANMDHRSFHLNFELGVLMVDNELNREINLKWREDELQSTKLESSYFEELPLLKKLFIRIARLFSPIF